MATVRELVTRYAFKADTAQVAKFDRAVANIKSTARGAGKAILKLGVGAGAMAAGIGKLVNDVSVRADQIAKVAKRVGVSGQFLQRLGHAAELSGTSLDEVTVSLRRLAGAAFESTRGSKETKNAFREVGVEVRKSDGTLKNVEQLTLEVFEGLGKMTDATKRAAIAQKLFGRAGQSMLPMLSAGPEGLRDMMAEADRLGIVLDNEALAGAENFRDALSRMKAVVSGVGAQIATSIMPAIEQSVKAVQAWVSENRELLAQITSGAIEVLGVALRTIGQVLKFVAENWKTVVAVMGVFAGVKALLAIISIAKAVSGVGVALVGVGKAALGAQAAMSAAGGASALLKGSLSKVGAVGAALGVGWVIGKKLDEWLGLSDKLSNALLGINKRFAVARVHRFDKDVRAQRISAMAQRLGELRQRGVQSVEGAAGGARVKLDQEGIARLLRAQAEKLGVSGQAQAELIPALISQLGRAPAGAVAPSKSVNVAPAQINVTVPAGTTPTQAKRVADAAGAATTAAMRRAMGDVAR